MLTPGVKRDKKSHRCDEHRNREQRVYDCYWFSTSKNISSNKGSRPQALVARDGIYIKT